MLVVDDEPQIVRGLRVILTNAGYRVEEATTKQEALDAVSVQASGRDRPRPGAAGR